MKTVRLLPVVVMAAGALLALKTVGLVSHGGYVLTGVGTAQAAGAAPAQEHGGETAGEDAIVLADPTIEDASPTIADQSPTVSGENVAESHSTGGHDASAEADHAAPEAGTEEAQAHDPACPPEGEAGAKNCPPEGGVVPMETDAAGNLVPLESGSGPGMTEQALLERLAARRDELDAYAAELDMRAALIEAAEQRVEERAAEMEALEARVSALVGERDAAEAELVAGVVSMYESMRPRDAATIFNELDMDVLLEVAKAMAPRKMAPILAEMDPTRAQELTVRLAAATPPQQEAQASTEADALPQIVGQ